MGEVYRARDPRLARDVAIKVLPAALASDADRLRRFEQEARAAGVLNHPNILAIHDIGSHDEAPYLVCELLDGETLRQRLLRGPLPSRKAIDFAVQIARGLGAAHAKGIVHRDVKPENLFITKDGFVRILDFGLAKLAGPRKRTSGETATAQLPAETMPGVVFGTAGYLSPEQVRGLDVDYRTDLFALGAILFEMLSGQRAFKGGTPADTISAILSTEPPELLTSGVNIPPGVDRIVRHCLEKDPADRFQSARDLEFDLMSLSVVSAQAPPPPRRLRRRLVRPGRSGRVPPRRPAWHFPRSPAPPAHLPQGLHLLGPLRAGWPGRGLWRGVEGGAGTALPGARRERRVARS
jgi:serine/threonine protein kinase